MLQNSFNNTESSNDIHPVIVQLPEFTIVYLGCPPEWITDNHTIATMASKRKQPIHTVSAVDIASNLSVLASHGHMPDC